MGSLASEAGRDLPQDASLGAGMMRDSASPGRAPIEKLLCECLSRVALVHLQKLKGVLEVRCWLGLDAHRPPKWGRVVSAGACDSRKGQARIELEFDASNWPLDRAEGLPEGHGVGRTRPVYAARFTRR